MPDAPSPGLPSVLLLLVLVAGVAVAIASAWPVWAGYTTLVAVLGGAWWVFGRDDREGQPVDVPAAEAAAAARKDRDDARRMAEFAEQRVEHERVEAVLDVLLAREGVRHSYRGPMGGHMDKREGTYTAKTPLPVSVQDVAALSGPLSQMTLVTAPDGRVYLTHLDARASDGTGIEVDAPAP